jgi:hypothetical protein
MADRLNITVPQAPNSPVGARNLVMLVLDSLRYDSLMEAGPKNISRLGEIQKRYTYATWTGPSHYNLLMGLVPHPDPIPAGMQAPEYLRNEFLRLSEMLQIDVGQVQRHHPPSLFLPTFLRGLGYHTRSIVTMPVLNSNSITNRDFESYDRMKRINDMDRMIDELIFDPKRPTFYLLNTGETHYPFLVPGDDVTKIMRISGMNGDADDGSGPISPPGPAPALTDAEIDQARQRQVRAAEYVDGLFVKLYEKLPPDTYLIVTSDHGELFGEEGQFGHGPFIHKKVLEVPLAEGLVPKS